MQLTQILDPRDPYAKLRRSQLVRMAAEKGFFDISEQMPKEVIVKRLKAKGFIPPVVPQRPLDALTEKIGASVAAPFQAAPSDAVEIDAADLAEREWQASQVNYDAMSMGQLKKLCKERGIYQSRRDKKPDVIARLRG